MIADLVRRPTPPEQAIALAEGLQVAFAGAAILMLVGVVLLGALVRRRDVANVNPEAPMGPVA